MKMQTAIVVEHSQISREYRVITLKAPGIASRAGAGQFVHLRVPGLDGSVLRRPFSIFKARNGCISILYKVIGKGTGVLANLERGAKVSLIGPLGRGFPSVRKGVFPVVVAGGYGVAPLSFLASSTSQEGVAFIGGSGKGHVLCVGEFRELGWKVHVATDDGSVGTRGLVTQLLSNWLQKARKTEIELFACGPYGMLKSVARLAKSGGWKAWISLDRHMGCGVGACLACVQKVRREGGTEKWARVCREGPVFESSEVVWK